MSEKSAVKVAEGGTVSFSQALRIVGCSHMWMRRMVTERGYFDAKKNDKGEWVLNESKVKSYAEHYRARKDVSAQPWK